MSSPKGLQRVLNAHNTAPAGASPVTPPKGPCGG